MGIFKKKSKKKAVPASAPEEPETSAEIEHMEEVSNPPEIDDVPKTTDEEMKYQQIPVCMSREQIYNLVIENNIMLKQIIEEID